MRRGVRSFTVAALIAMTAVTVAASTDLNAAVNAYRVAYGVPALTTSAQLEQVAAERAVEVSTNFAHVDLARRVGCNWGEIIAWNTADDPIPWAINQWAGSPSHLAVMVGGWTWIGSGTYSVGGRAYLVVLFLKPCDGPPIGPPIVDVIPDTSMGAP